MAPLACSVVAVTLQETDIVHLRPLLGSVATGDGGVSLQTFQLYLEDEVSKPITERKVWRQSDKPKQRPRHR